MAELAGRPVPARAAALGRGWASWRTRLLGQGRLLESVVLVGPSDRGRGAFRRGRAVPEPAAVEPGSSGFHDRLQFGLQPSNVVDHAQRRALLLAGGHWLPDLGAHEVPRHSHCQERVRRSVVLVMETLGGFPNPRHLPPALPPPRFARPRAMVRPPANFGALPPAAPRAAASR